MCGPVLGLLAVSGWVAGDRTELRRKSQREAERSFGVREENREWSCSCEVADGELSRGPGKRSLPGVGLGDRVEPGRVGTGWLSR